MRNFCFLTASAASAGALIGGGVTGFVGWWYLYGAVIGGVSVPTVTCCYTLFRCCQQVKHCLDQIAKGETLIQQQYANYQNLV